MRVFKKIAAIVFLVFACLVLLALQWLSSFDYTLSRLPPDKAGLLLEIDDEAVRAVFAGLSLVDVREDGFQDSLITSRWCGLAPDAPVRLFGTGFVKDGDAASFVSAAPITKPYARFGIRDLGYRSLAIGIEPQGDCLDFYVTEFS
jgi:hypothetical protein